MEMLLAPQNLLFSLALGVVVVLGVLQLLLGIGGAVDIGDADVDSDIDTPFSAALDWLYFGRIPLSILVILWCLSFSGAGFLSQILVKGEPENCCRSLWPRPSLWVYRCHF
jgi:hypothetical protein